MAESEWNARARAEAKLGRVMSEAEWNRKWARRTAREDAERNAALGLPPHAGRAQRDMARAAYAGTLQRRRRSKAASATLKVGALAAVGGILYGLLKRRSR